MILFALFLVYVSIGRLHETLSETLSALTQVQNDIRGISHYLYRSQNKSNHNEYEIIP